MTIEGNRWYVRGNEFSGGFMDWVVTIKPTFVGNGLLLRWEVIFSEGSGGRTAPSVYCKTCEEAFDLVENYREQIKFDNLMSQLYHDQSSEEN